LSFTVFLDLTDEGFEIEESVTVGDRRFPVTEALDGTAAFFRFFLDGFIEGRIGLVIVSENLMDSPTGEQNLRDRAEDVNSLMHICLSKS
jgi:hypothetical protein